MPEKIVLKNADVPGITGIDVYLQYGGYDGLRKALKEFTPEQITDMVKQSGLRGHQVGVHPQERLASLPGVQCRRGRAGHLQRPRHHGEAAA
jgi:hypothetical protein